MKRRLKSLLGGSGIIVFNSDEEMACLNRANASTQVQMIDQTVTSLARDWKPTGFYRPADVQKMLDTLAAEASTAGAVLAAAPLSTSDAQAAKDQAFKDLLAKYKDRSNGFARAVATAQQTNAAAINAPGFKDFVLASMRSISDAYVTAAVLQCRQSWTESILDRGYRAVAAIGGLAASIISVTIEIGENVVDATETAARIIAAVVKVAPWAAIGVAGILAYGFVQRRGVRGLLPRFRRESPIAGLFWR